MKNPSCNCTDRCIDCAKQPICCYCYTDIVYKKIRIDDILDDVDIDSPHDMPYWA